MVTICQRQVRTAPAGGILGLDLGAAIQIGIGLGYDAAALAELLPAAEAGMMAAFDEARDGNRE